MNSNTYKNLLSIVKGESFGTINVYSKTEFDETAKSIMGYGCFGHVIERVLLEAIVKRITEWRKNKIIDESYDCFDSFCDDMNYTMAFQFENILFPSVLCHITSRDKGNYEIISSIYHFKTVDSIDVINICDMFNEPYKDYVRNRIEGVDDSEKIVSMILDNSIIVPF